MNLIISLFLIVEWIYSIIVTDAVNPDVYFPFLSVTVTRSVWDPVRGSTLMDTVAVTLVDGLPRDLAGAVLPGLEIGFPVFLVVTVTLFV